MTSGARTEATAKIVVAMTDATGSGQASVLQSRVHPGDTFDLIFTSETEPDARYREQITIARDYLRKFLNSHPLRELVEPHRRGCTVEVLHHSGEELGDGSHGLALLVLGLASLLELQPKIDRVFSAQLAPPPSDLEAIVLRPVAGISEKALAVAEYKVRELLYHADSTVAIHGGDARLREYQRRHRQRDPAYQCRPAGLSRTIRWENLLNLGFDLHPLWRRLSETVSASSQIALATAHRLTQVALFRSAQTSEFPYGVGSMIAQVRAQGACPVTLPEQLGILDLVKRCSDDQLPDLVKIAISEAADSRIESDFAAWLSNSSAFEDLRILTTPLARAVWIFDVGVYRRWITPAQIRSAAHCIANRVKEFLLEIRLSEESVKQLGQLEAALRSQHSSDEEFQKTIVGILVDTITKNQKTPFRNQIAALHNYLVSRVLDPRDIYDGAGAPLQLSFFTEKDGVPSNTCPRCDRSFFAPILNDMRLRYSSANISATIESPVLLSETVEDEPRHTRRLDYRLSDDTMSRIPKVASDMIGHLFGATPTRIEFLLQREDQDPPSAVGILWKSGALGFPPAIDSQILVRALQKWHREDPGSRSIRSVLDVGCGTGYLAAAAAFLHPEVDYVELCDVDDFIVRSAARNLRTAVRTENSSQRRSTYSDPIPNASIRTTAGDFVLYQPDRVFDLVVCNPPYLPELQLASTDIERATSGTRVLEALIEKSSSLGRNIFVVFSNLAWREFENALTATFAKLPRIILYDRQLVPLRAPWIAPFAPQEQRSGVNPYLAQEIYEQRLEYFQGVLAPRGLIDLDLGETSWQAFVRDLVANPRADLFADTPNSIKLEDRSGLDGSRWHASLEALRVHSRGFRFWHETRVVLIQP